MELKLVWVFTTVKVAFLLIEPMWNWNDWRMVGNCCLCQLLIEPMWNWNAIEAYQKATGETTFNRTNVELKQFYLYAFSGIVTTFNRTNVELKRGYAKPPIRWVIAFNRTNVELKLDWAKYFFIGCFSFNRTNVELKPDIRYFSSLFHPLLIEPMWNWNT